MKTNLSISLRWRMAIVLLLLLWGVGGAFAQVSVTNTATNYAAKQISFTVSWTATPHNNQIWVITDYVKVENATTVGGWSRALVTGATATGNGSAATVTGQRGFWLNTSGSSGSATITATLSGVPAQFNWCAYALNYPPRAVIKAAGGYDLKGTPPFTVNGTTLGDNVTTFGAGTCITSLSDATNNPTSVLPDLPTVSTSNPAARCGAGAVTLAATAGGGTTTAMTYTWVVGGGAAQTTTSGSLPLSSVAEGSTTYSVTVTNANGCTSAAKTGTITVYSNFSAGAITTASGSTTESTDPNVTIANETDASGGDGVITYEWRRSGTSSATFSYSNTTYPISNSTTNYSTPGTYYFTRYAHDGTCNTAWVASSGQYTLTVAATPPPSAGTNTYTCGTQIWSEPVRIAACNKSSFTESTTTPYCRSYTYNSITYYYYNWSYVISYGSTTLCPQPWRVPTADDFQTLMSCLGASPTANIYYPESSTWGGSMGGFTRRDGMHVNGSQAMYRTTTNYNATAAYYFHLNTSHGNVLQTYKVYGMQVRCVR